MLRVLNNILMINLTICIWYNASKCAVVYQFIRFASLSDDSLHMPGLNYGTIYIFHDWDTIRFQYNIV